MKFLAAATFAVVAHCAIDKFGDLGDLGKFDFGGFDLLGGVHNKAGKDGKAGKAGKDGKLPKKGPFRGSVPICFFVDEFGTYDVLTIDGVSLKLVCEEITEGEFDPGTASGLIFHVDTGMNITAAFSTDDDSFSADYIDLPACASDRRGEGLGRDFYTFVTTEAGRFQREMPYSCVIADDADPDTRGGRPETDDIGFFSSKFENGISINYASSALSLFTSGSRDASLGFDSLCGVWGTLDITVPKGVPFSVPTYDDMEKGMKETYKY
uniref:Uncharacterized protein n=1 Tax=Chromera velia CCMP2878 TaxID=1169474 RepID=A0A0G4FSC9_9ALVE|eukprot:Cvel_18526.t1-p1 / transcript=Cvel_18526.t1 / gene=Cvel_18526 / organism=Chromera_velia_CCMP2878 / gene_product=hypothetical protein / transcript_product=hypothetical protein / location=Cvel_scaffold1540:24783-26525(+) / protein_length=266 / sequence_SO=supercontig / SO=protein_coding / is_pseudo=false